MPETRPEAAPLDIEEDVLHAARELALRQGSSLGQALSLGGDSPVEQPLYQAASRIFGSRTADCAG